MHLSKEADDFIHQLIAEELALPDDRHTFGVTCTEIIVFLQVCLKALGYTTTIPKNLDFHGAQVFFDRGQPQEIRISGEYQRKSSTRGRLETVSWPPPDSPYRNRIGKPCVEAAGAVALDSLHLRQGRLLLDVADVGRCNISACRISVSDAIPGSDAAPNLVWLSVHSGTAQADPLPLTPSVTAEMATVPNSFFFAAVQQALAYVAESDRWKTYHDGAKYSKYFDIGKRADDYKESLVSLNDLPVRVIYSVPKATPTEVEARFAAMSPDLVADVLDILTAHWLAQDRPHHTTISLSDVLRARGRDLQPYNFKSHTVAVHDAFALRLAVGSPTAGYSVLMPSKSESDTGGPGIRGVGQHQLISFGAGANIRHATTARLPDNQSNFYNPTLATAFGPRLWHLDPRKYSWAKRLARYLRVDWRRNPEAYARCARYRTWRSHFEDAGINPVGHYRNEFRTFEKALAKQLEKLVALDIIGGNPQADINLYVNPYGKSLWSRISTLELFLDLQVCLPPPSNVQQHNAKYKPSFQPNEPNTSDST